jgi:ComF family protein
VEGPVLARAIRTTADAVLSIALAPVCAACVRPLDRPTLGPVCPACWASVRAVAEPRCRTCGDPLPSWRTVSLDAERCARCRRTAPAIARGCAAGEYEGALREILHAFKYDGRRTLAPRLGALMRDAGGELLRDAHCAVPVPLHVWRRVRRGFNQAGDLAAALGLPVVHALSRSRATRPQSGLSAARRRQNVGHAFRLSPWLTQAARARWLADRVVILVDDVRTTGATLDACARVLKGAGAAEVRAITAARAAPPRAR